MAENIKSSVFLDEKPYALVVVSNVSEEFAASFFKTEERPLKD
jgi:hypothetical protein